MDGGSTIGPHATGVSLPRFSAASVKEPPYVPPVAVTVTQTRVERLGFQTPGFSSYVSSKMTAESLNDAENDGCSGGGRSLGSGSSNPQRHSPPENGNAAPSKPYVPTATQSPEHVQSTKQLNTAPWAP